VKKTRNCITLLVLSFFSFVIAQEDVGVKQWKDHLGFFTANSITGFGPYIVASNYSSLLFYNKSDNSLKKVNRINKLNDVGIRLVRSSPDGKFLLVIYENSNIDILDANEQIFNFSDLKNKILNANKIINDVSFHEGFAYLSCGFGILKFDYKKNEIKDSYIIGQGGTYLEVYQTCLTDSVMFAATSKGLYRCRYKQKNPANFANWTVITNSMMRQIHYSGVVLFNGKVLASQSNYLKSGVNGKDTVFIWDGTMWQIFSGKLLPYTVKKLSVTNNFLSLIDQFGVQYFDNLTAFKDYVTSYPGAYADVADSYAELKSGYPQYWIADNKSGFLKMEGSSPYYLPQYFNIGGLHSAKISNIDIFKGKIAVAPVLIDNSGLANYDGEGINIKDKNGDWKYLKKPGHPSDTLFDLCHVLIDRKNPEIIWVSSWVKGLAEYRGNDLYAVYNEYNTNNAITPILPAWWRVSGKDMDEDGNLWFAVSDVPEYLCVRTKDGNFQKFNPDGLPRFVRKLLVTKDKDVWILHEREQGITVVRPKKNGANFTLEKVRILTKNENAGNLGSNSVLSAVQDADGRIWVGTATGLRVFSNPRNVFDSPDGEPIKIIQGANVELLLEGESVTCMDVDAANNKWVGTYSGGVYCFSPDGQRTLLHFTKDNSPLYSNEIHELKIDQSTGDVYIATPYGLQSYKNVFIEPFENYDALHAFPNPVRKGYAGSVYISGLMENSQVKITDVAGNIVWEGKSSGGRIEWPLVNMQAERVVSGIYIVYASLTTAEMKKLGKILVQ
jgi:WD40 repeat protein